MHKCIYTVACVNGYFHVQTLFLLCLPHPGHKSQHLPVTLENSFAKYPTALETTSPLVRAR